jgi:hypothetical protein
MIKPTVGRVVLFHPDVPREASQPDKTLAATVANVWSENCVNLTVHNEDGTTRPVTSVRLVQAGEAPPVAGPWCEWMPFQKGQAAKLEPDLEKLFTYHPPKITEKGEQALRYGNIRSRARDLAHYLIVECPESRERSLAIQAIEEAVFWANAAIARNE